MPSLEHFCTITATLDLKLIGQVPAGMRIDFPFTGTATGPHWEGELPVEGVDYVTVRSDRNMDLDVHGRIGEGPGVVSYRAGGVSIGIDRTTAEPNELITFETANEDLAFLNTEIAVGLGRGEGADLTLDIYLVKR